MKLRWSLYILLFFVSVLRLSASDVSFHSINALYGISMRENHSVCKDDNGFLWTSSKTGILRLAGENYHVYQLPYNTADIISVQLVYSNSLLIAYTNNGQLFRYDELHDRFDLFLDMRTPLEFLYLNVSKIVVDDDRTLWIATSAGVYKYKDGKLVKVLEEPMEIHSLVFFDETRLCLATAKGIGLLDVNTVEYESLHRYKADNELQVTSSFYDRKTRRFWFGTFSDGLFYYDMDSRQLHGVPAVGFPRQPARVVSEYNDSTLLVGVDGQGIWELSRNGEQVLNVFKEDIDNPLSLRGNGIHDIYCDESGRVWVTTYSGGLSFYDRKPSFGKQIVHVLNNPNSLGNNNVNKVIEDHKGDIWFATDNGISRWQVAANQWHSYYQNNQEQAQVFLALCEDSRGNIWAGSYSSGFYILDGNTGKELGHYSWKHGSELSGKFIYDIYRDSCGDMWVGGLQDVLCYFSDEKRFHSYPGQPLRSFAEFAPGKMLLACTYGLLLMDKETENIEYLGTYFAQDILVMGNDIWVATCGDGLVHYNYKDKKTEKITTEMGLPSNFVNSVLFDKGYLWVGTESGLCRLDPADRTVQTYFSASSLLNTSFNVNSCCKLANGELIWGTSNGAVSFDAAGLYQSQPKGRIFFQDISISGRSMREMPELLRETPVDKQAGISLRYNQNTLAVELLPIGISSERVKFSWKMEGLDAGWSVPSVHRIATYTNLPNGSFLLKVRMYDSSLSRLIDERVFAVQVIPPYWATRWFCWLVFVVIAGVAFFSLKYYINSLKQRHAEDKIRFFANTAHDIRTSLTLISAPIEELNKEKGLSEKGQYYLHLATEQSGRLSCVATQLLDFQKVDIGKGQLFLIMSDVVALVNRRISMFESEAGKNRIKLNFCSNRESFFTAIDELKIEKVTDNLLSNAIKYSHPDSRVDILLTCSEDEWSLEVRDYGLGISENARKKLFKEFYRGDNTINSKIVGSGIGLLLVKNYVSMHLGKISLDSKENEGSSFKIIIPYRKTENAAVLAGAEEQAGTTDACKIPVRPDTPSGQEDCLDGSKKRQLLIVEDNNDLQGFLQSAFSGQYNVWMAGDGVEAWELLRKETPDLIISDVMMPNMDGFELCRLIKSTFETSHIPVILLTSLCDKSDQLEGLGLGADDYMTKPFDMTILSQRIKSLVRNREVIREKALKLISQEADDVPVLANKMNDTFLKKALEVVHENLAFPEFDKEAFALAMHVSSSLLYKKMKALTGQSPIEFIKAIRMNYALELLQARSHTITEVSELCGFSSCSYFSTVFKKHFGKSPTEV